MTTETRTPADDDRAAASLAEHLLDLLSSGATVGDLRRFTTDDYETLYALGHSLYMRGRHEDAVKVFSFLLIHNPRDRRFVMALGGALQMSGDLAGAIRAYTMASVMDMGDPSPCLHTCECLIALGRHADAAEGLAMVLRQCEKPPREDLRRRAGELLEIASRQAAATKEKH